MKQTTSVGVASPKPCAATLRWRPARSRAAETEGRSQGHTLEFTVTITFDDLDAMIADPNHAGRITGTVERRCSAGPLTVEDGVFELFKSDPGGAMRLMVYACCCAAAARASGSGRRRCATMAASTCGATPTTLAVDIEDIGGTWLRAASRTFRCGFLRQLTTMRAVNAPSAASGLRAVSRFGMFFQNRMRSIYGRMFAPRERLIAAGERQRRALRCGEGERIPIRTQDGVELKLTRFKGGDKGPVLLTPGFGTSSLAYLIDTVDTNLPEYLFERGYDVWLLDYRASPDLKSSTTQFTLDDIARYDYPAAVGAVREHTGAPSIQMMAHCVGSLTFQMAQTLGLQGVRSAICSQLTLHPKLPMLNHIKGRLYLANLIKAAGFDTLTTTFTDNFAERAFDVLLRLYPSRYQRSANPTLHRILFLYGDVIKLESSIARPTTRSPKCSGPPTSRHSCISATSPAPVTRSAEGEDCPSARRPAEHADHVPARRGKSSVPAARQRRDHALLAARNGRALQPSRHPELCAHGLLPRQGCGPGRLSDRGCRARKHSSH